MKNLIYGILVLILSSCTIGLEPDVSGGTVYDTELLTSTLEIELGNTNGISSSATIPFKKIEEGIPFENGSMDNYPEQGQRTTWKINETDQTNIYKVEVTTVYDYTNYVDRTFESYYFQDVGTLEEYSTDDPIYNIETNQTDNKYREEFYTIFNGDIRRDEIIESIDDLTNFPDEFLNIEDITYSSVVTYEQIPQEEVDTDNLRLDGTRYYAEYSDGTSKTVIIEEGFAVNMSHEGRVIRGRSEFEGEIIIEIDSGKNRNVEGSYNFDNGDIIIQI